MSVLPAFDLERPSRLEDVLAAISESASPYAGGTELLLAMKAGLLRPDTLVDLKRVDSLLRISSDGDPISIGGAVTHRRAVLDSGIRERLSVLAAVLERVGNPRVRAVGTLGGNLCFAEPKSDVATILIALCADVRLVSARETRVLPVEEFVVGPYTTTRADDEILSEILVPVDGSRAVYEKFQTMERPTVGVAGSIASDGSVRIVVGAVGGSPHLVTAASLDAVDAHAIAAEIDVIPDMTGSARYKRHVTRLYVQRALASLGGHEA
jgi:carbon-monoxide dehydrogenase medium subunit